MLLSLPPLAGLEGLIARILAAVHELDALQALPAGAIVWVQPQHHLVRVFRHGHVTCTQVTGVNIIHGCLSAIMQDQAWYLQAPQITRPVCCENSQAKAMASRAHAAQPSSALI